MKKYSIIKLRKIGFALFGLLFVPGCQTEDSDLKSIDPTVAADNSAVVFSDTFSSGLDYAAFGGSDLLGFQVDNKVSYNGSAASMRFDVPNVGDPDGGFTGGTFFSTGGRNLTGYNVLTFWAKGLQAATIEIGIGLDDKGSKDYIVSCTQKLVLLGKNIIFPIPDASKLKFEKGLLYVSAGAKNTDGYTFWLDEVKYENIEDVILLQATINSGKDSKVCGPAPLTIDTSAKYGLPNGGNIVVKSSPKYFVFVSDNESVATVDNGVLKQLSSGTATISAILGGVDAVGSLEVTSSGVFVHASTPTRNASNVVSVFSDAYTKPNAQYNLYWQPYQTTTSADFNVDGDNVLNYLNFNFVGIGLFDLLDASSMTHLHLDMYIPCEVPSNFDFLVTIVDFGLNGVEGGGDDIRKQLFVPKSGNIKANEWLSIELALNMTQKSNIGYVILENINLPKGPGLSQFYADNIYFYKE